jgi:hypothetical protein
VASLAEFQANTERFAIAVVAPMAEWLYWHELRKANIQFVTETGALPPARPYA